MRNIIFRFLVLTVLISGTLFVSNNKVAADSCDTQLAQSTSACQGIAGILSQQALSACIQRAWDDWAFCRFGLGAGGGGGGGLEPIQNDLCEVLRNEIYVCGLNFCPDGVCTAEYSACVDIATAIYPCL